MAYDAGMLAAIVHEINSVCAHGARVDKVLMPQKDEVVLVIHAGRENYRLSLNASGNAPRMTFTSVLKENPLSPPMFCMLLRKYLVGAIVQEATQEGFERVARLRFSSRDEMGFSADVCLMAEIMGKYSNLILLDSHDKILGVLRVVDFTTSRLRQVLPGMTYELPPPQDKIDPRTVSEEDFLSHINAADPFLRGDKYITSTYLGTATQVARELVWQASGRCDSTLDEIDHIKMSKVFVSHFSALKKGEFSPTFVTDLDGKPLDYAYSPVHYFEGGALTFACENFSDLFDRFYAARERQEALHLKAADVSHVLRHEISRLTRKIEAQRCELAEAEKALGYRHLGDLLTANLYAIKRGDTIAYCTDWEAEGMPQVAVALDSRLSPSANAQRYYKLYNKGKTARSILVTQIKQAEEELAYLDAVSVFLDAAETPEDIEGIRAELRRAGYMREVGRGGRPEKKKNPTLKSFTTPSGYRLLVGMNNLQNEYLTFTVADRGDLWFHVKGMPGSHVVLCCAGEEPSEDDYTMAAVVAAHYSRAKGKGTAVDYTRVRELKRVPGAHPGFVVYHTNYSAYVDPGDFEKWVGGEGNG
ncbi:MAG: NFACT family protein [Clostridia bacterium]|nr:NFACT family protein [Clostridia bacterium]